MIVIITYISEVLLQVEVQVDRWVSKDVIELAHLSIPSPP